MSLTLSAPTLARVEAASRALLSPLAAPTVHAWQEEVNARLGQLLGGEHTLFRLPSGDGSHFTTDGPELVQGLMTYAQEVTPEMITYWDDAPNVWHRDRRTLGIESFTWDTVSEVVRQGGLAIDRAPVWNEVFFAQNVRDYAGLITTRPEGDAILWTLGSRLTTTSTGRTSQRALLQLLVPAFKAGLDALDRLRSGRLALDALAEPLAAFDADGREVFRNAALVRLLAADPQRERVEGAVRLVARALRPAAAPVRSDAAAPPGAPAREVQTERGRYALTGTVLPGGLIGADRSALVSVSFAESRPALPSAEAVRARHGLTKRESEVALLLAEGLTNDGLADRLFVSVHTARHHVEAVLLKLGVNTRAAVAAALLQPG